MNKSFFILLFSTLLSMSAVAQKGKMDYKLTEDWSRKPDKVTPAKKGKAPSDAIVLLDGKNLDAWESTKGDTAATWRAKRRWTEVVPKSGGIRTKQKFGDCQLHVEWEAPKKDVKAGLKGQQCGNSGIFLMGRYEVQVLNSYENETYYNGMAGSIYKQHIPLVNPTVKPGKWQAYDIIFTAPRFNEDKTLKTPAYITVFLNGILIQNHVELKGPTVFVGEPSYTYHEPKAPLMLQDHKNKVRYRNIWIREL